MEEINVSSGDNKEPVIKDKDVVSETVQANNKPDCDGSCKTRTRPSYEQLYKMYEEQGQEIKNLRALYIDVNNKISTQNAPTQPKEEFGEVDEDKLDPRTKQLKREWGL